MEHTEKSSTDSNPFLVRQIHIPEGTPQLPAEVPKQSDSEMWDENPAEPPVETYQKRYGLPYVAEAMDLRAIYGRTGQEEQLGTIDSYILGQINADGLKSTQEAYRSVLSKLEAKLELDPNLDYPERIDRLFAYVKMLQTQKELTFMRKLING